MLTILGLAAIFGTLFGCAPLSVEEPAAMTETPIGSLNTPTPSGPTATPLPQRPVYQPGELVSYTAQTGDTLPALAARFNTTVGEIRETNPIIPSDATTMPPGLPMEIPIYYRAFWGTPFQIIPDSQFVNGPAGIDFETAKFPSEYRGWINTYQEYAAGENRNGPALIELVASNYSVSPRLLLAVSEYLAGALTNPALPEASSIYPLRHRNPLEQGYYRQLIWTANTLNQGYYQWRMGTLLELDLPDGTLERPDPWQNAASVALQYLFSQVLTADEYRQAISPEGFAATWLALYGDPWAKDEPHIPGSLRQPGLLLPYPAGQIWAYTGGPHTAWGSGEPAAAIDFAPATSTSGCYISNEWTTAMADGLVTRAEPGFIMLDLDKDGDERTGWVLFYLHVEGRDMIAQGTEVQAGDILGHPSCDGGNATGTHVHIARKYNGEWMIADSPVPFVMEGWQVIAGARPYQGQLKRFEKTITASESAILGSSLQATGNFDGVVLTPLPTPTPVP
jgi:murein DD-endopeptidase MepM/ murein hydrolase activator NlpD